MELWSCRLPRGEGPIPTELRHLLFQPAEVVRAVREYHRRLGHALPPGAIVSYDPECQNSGEILSLRLTIAPGETTVMKGGEGGQQDVFIPGPALAAALILYYRDHNIPLAASAGKSLRLYGNQVCLVTTINPRQGQRR